MKNVFILTATYESVFWRSHLPGSSKSYPTLSTRTFYFCKNVAYMYLL